MVYIIPIGIAYSRINPRIRDQVALCIEKPLTLNDFEGFSINDFNNILRNKINEAELNALGLVGRWLYDQLQWSKKIKNETP